MSFSALARAVNDLPASLSDQILNYARSVESALPEIFKEAQVKYSQKIANEMIFIAGVRKLFAIVDSTYWVLDNTGAILERQNLHATRIGGTDFSRNSEYYYTVYKLRKDIFKIFEQYQILDLVAMATYTELLRELAHGR